MSSDSADYGTACREVDWYAVAVFAESLLTRFDRLPTPGTPSWSALSDRDPVKLAAVISVARFWALTPPADRTPRSKPHMPYPPPPTGGRSADTCGMRPTSTAALFI